MERKDDPAIAGDVVLLRRIPNKADRVTWDAKGEPVATSYNFRDKDNELSVHVESLTTHAKVMEGHDGFGLAAVKASDVRAILGESAVICEDPEDKGKDPAHKIICCEIDKRKARQLQEKTWWVIKPARPDSV